MKLSSLCHCVQPLLIIVLIFSDTQVTAQEGPGIVVAHPGQDVELLCTVTRISNNEAVEWIVDHEGQHGVNALFNSILPGYSTNGNNLIVENIIMNDGRNNSEYRCVIVLQVTSTIQRESNHTILYVAGVPTMVPVVTVKDNTINIDGSNVTLTLSWGKPFNNFDPIVNYTVSCSGNVTCPPDFTTTDNTTRSYTITNLTSMTNYIFSVVATNSIGSGEASRVMITTPACHDHTRRYNRISSVLQWDNDECNPATAEFHSTSVSDAMISTPNASSTLQFINVTCTIHPDSTADQCVVMAMADGRVTRTGTAPITNGTATVAVNGLQCEVTYTIIAGGTLNGNLVGPRSSHGTVTTYPCPLCPVCLVTSCESDDTVTIIGAVVGAFCVVIIIIVITNIMVWIYCFRKRHHTGTSLGLHSPTKDTINPAYHTITDDHSKRSTEEPVSYYEDVKKPAEVKMTPNPAYSVP